MSEKILGEVTWTRPESIKNKVFLICIGEKCMSGNIIDAVYLKEDKYRVTINFIEPSYFKRDVGKGVEFTLREASRILATGVFIQ